MRFAGLACGVVYAYEELYSPSRAPLATTVMKLRGLSGPFQETLNQSPAAAWAGPVSVPVTAPTVSGARASVVLVCAVRYRTSYSPGASGATMGTGLPLDKYSYRPQVCSAAPDFTMVM